MYRALGVSISAQATCPQCSYLCEGSCKVCADGDEHPGCEGCADGKPKRSPWYKSDFMLAVSSATLVSLTVALLVPRIEARLKK